VAWVGHADTQAAGDRQVELALVGHQLVVVEGVPLLGIDVPNRVLALELEDTDPVDLGIARLVVLFDTGVDAAAAADAAGEVEAVAEDHPVVGTDRPHRP
jgi:hypothetical protein